MPAKSKAQYRLMLAVATGEREIKGITKKMAQEWLASTTNPSHLPERLGPNRKKAKVIK